MESENFILSKMVLGELYNAGKFAWNDLGLGKFVKKNAGKLIGSVVKRLPDTWRDKAIAAAEMAKSAFGNSAEISENITTGVNEAKGIKTEAKTQTEKENIPQPQPPAMPQPQTQTIRYVNALGKAKHIRLRRRINRPPLARLKARLKLNSAKFASKKRRAKPVRG